MLGFVSCRDFHVNLMGDITLAEVDGKMLMQSELSTVVPKEYRGEDSVAFVELYIDKWIRKQVKLREAERIFFTSEDDIEAMVEEYRQLLLMKKLDDQYLNSSSDTIYTDSQILSYYNANASNFKLNSNIIKGEVLRLPQSHTQAKKVKELMSQTSDSKRADLLSICEKYDFEFTDLSESWVDASQLFDLLSMTRSVQTDKLLTQRGVNHMKDDSFDYYYRILDNKMVGDCAPLEWVRSTIRTILVTERQHALIRSSEEMLYRQAHSEGVVRFQYQEREAKEREKREKEEKNKIKISL